MYERQKLRRAKQRVADLTAFYFHAFIYAVSVPLMIAINFHASPEWWAQFPSLIWGLGLLAHACAVFGAMPRFVERWQVRKIKQLIEDERI
ncbi:MAG: 2TM domain-containing protein [Pseudomonadota bacterium]